MVSRTQCFWTNTLWAGVDSSLAYFAALFLRLLLTAFLTMFSKLPLTAFLAMSSMVLLTVFWRRSCSPPFSLVLVYFWMRLT